MNLKRMWRQAMKAMVLMAAVGGRASTAFGEDPIKLLQSIPMPKVTGFVDHIALDTKRDHLFVAALVNNTVEIADLHSGAIIHTITGFREPMGILYLPEQDQFVVADYSKMACRFYDAGTFEQKAIWALDDKPDNIRYDPVAKLLYMGCMDGTFQARHIEDGTVASTLKLNSRPEAFAMESHGPRIYMNLPKEQCVAVIDRNRNEVIARWPLNEVTENYTIALDEANQRVFVGCRAPSRMLVFDAQSGKILATLQLMGDCDDMHYDPPNKLIYASCGRGTMDIFAQKSPDEYELVARVPTGPRARTSLFIPELHRLYVAIPRQKTADGELRIYETPKGSADPKPPAGVSSNSPSSPESRPAASP